MSYWDEREEEQGGDQRLVRWNPDMRRVRYISGIDRAEAAEACAGVRHWLINASIMWREDGELPEWAEPYEDVNWMWDPGTATTRPITEDRYRGMMGEVIRPEQLYLSYDTLGDPERTLYTFRGFLNDGYDPVPVIQPGMDPQAILDAWEEYGGGLHRTVFIGGILQYSSLADKLAYLDGLFYPEGPTRLPAWMDGLRIHLGGVHEDVFFQRYPAVSSDDSRIIRRVHHGEGTYEDYLPSYGEIRVPFLPPDAIQPRLTLPRGIPKKRNVTVRGNPGWIHGHG